MLSAKHEPKINIYEHLNLFYSAHLPCIVGGGVGEGVTVISI